LKAAENALKELGVMMQKKSVVCETMALTAFNLSDAL
jgi:hypothetical protein